ncbi:cytochrome P450 (plasmid) [Rhodococcus globerulus]|uniref:cytochrome P450 n=1 Tax=Rhodococcus globerulus TaxID=33008 RepID=UPI0039E79013
MQTHDDLKFPPFPFKRECPFTPPAEYDELRSQPLHRVQLPTGGHAWIATRYDDVVALLTSTSVSSDPSHVNFPALGIGEREAAIRARPFIRMDGAEHSRYRRAFLSEFTARRIRPMRPAVQSIVDAAIDEFEGQDKPANYVRHIANVVSTGTICQLLGVPDADYEYFRDVVRISGSRRSSAAEVGGALQSLFELIDGLVEWRMREPGEDLLSRFVLRNLVEGEFERHEVRAALAMVVIAARETTTGTIALGTLQLLQRRDLIEQIKADPDLVPGAVDELLRFTTVSDTLPLRVATRDIDVSGSLIREGDGIICLLGAANHDPAKFPNPQELDFRREARHLTFGHGAHACFGANLAQMEMQCLYGSLFTRLPGLALATPLADVEFKHEAASFGVEEMLVTW